MITSDQARISYSITTSPQSFAVPFYILSSADVRVIATSTAGVDTDLVLNSDYTVTGAATNPSTAQVVGVTGRTGQTLAIVRSAQILQPSSYASNDRFPATTQEKNMDRMTMLIQQLREEVKRGVRFPLSNAEAGVMPLNSRKNKRLGFDAVGAMTYEDPIAVTVATGDVLEVSSYSAARAISSVGLTTGRQVRLSGYAASNDGGGGLFTVTTSDPGDDNNGTILELDDGLAWLVRNFTGGVDLKWFGAKGDGTTNDTVAVLAANVYAKANDLPFYVSPGVFKVTATLDIDVSDFEVYGDGPGVSQILFAPLAEDILFNVAAANPANLIVGVAFRDFGLLAEYPADIKKTAFKFSDASLVTVDNVRTVDNSWTTETPSSASELSVGFHFCGRDQHTIRNCFIAADRPVYIGKNPNSSTYQFDVYHFHDLAMQTLAADQYAITFAPGVNISQWTVDGRCIALTGKGGIFYNDTDSGTASSSNITIRNFRVESGVASGGDAGGYAMQFTFCAPAPRCGNMIVENCSGNDPTMNGFYFDGVAALQLTNVNSSAGSGLTALGCQNVNTLKIVALGVTNDAALVTLTNMSAKTIERPFEIASNLDAKSITEGLYQRRTADTPAQVVTEENGLRRFRDNRTLEAGDQMVLPPLAEGEILSLWVIVGDASSSGLFGWAHYLVAYGSVTKIDGDADFGISGGGAKLTVLAGAGTPPAKSNPAIELISVGADPMTYGGNDVLTVGVFGHYTVFPI